MRELPRSLEVLADSEITLRIRDDKGPKLSREWFYTNVQDIGDYIHIGPYNSGAFLYYNFDRDELAKHKVKFIYRFGNTDATMVLLDGNNVYMIHSNQKSFFEFASNNIITNYFGRV